MEKRWVKDSKIPGLCISRGKSWVFRYGMAGSWDRSIKLGNLDEMSVTEARRKAEEHRATLRDGGDPAVVKKELKADKTLAELHTSFIDKWAKPRKSSWQNDDGYFRNHLLKAPFARWRLQDIDQATLWDWHASHPNQVTANRCLETLSKAYGLAKLWGWLPRAHENPCKGIEHFPEKSRRRYATPEELERLLFELRKKKAQGGIHFRFACMIQLLMLTGARLNEIMSARWSEVDLREGVIRPTKHKTDKTEHREIVLGHDAERVVLELRNHEKPGEWLIRGRGQNHLAEHHKPWTRLKAAAQVEGLWVHDLRHTFASYLISSGHSLGVIAELLGHASQQTTKRYSHLIQTARRRAVDASAEILLQAGSTDPHTSGISASLPPHSLHSTARDTESPLPCNVLRFPRGR